MRGAQRRGNLLRGTAFNRSKGSRVRVRVKIEQESRENLRARMRATGKYFNYDYFPPAYPPVTPVLLFVGF